jgi:cell division protein FtsQ
MSGAGVGAALGRLPRAAATRARSVLTPSPKARVRALAVLVLALALAALYMLWFRDSGLVRVEKVTVTGLTARSAPRIQAALSEAAGGMTTLHVREDELERAVADFSVVHHLRVSPDFPHGLRIEVIERTAVAVAVDSSGKRVAVAGDGMVLPDVTPAGDLPSVQVDGLLPRWKLGDPDALLSVTVIAAAPRALAARIETVREESRGIVVELTGGPLVILGDRARLEAKWAATARVLAEPDADGAEYVDVRIPERPVAGGLAIEPIPPEPGTEVAPAAPAPVAPEAAPAVPEPAPGAVPGAAAPPAPNTQPGVETTTQP